jgi:hypothetical protein
MDRIVEQTRRLEHTLPVLGTRHEFVDQDTVLVVLCLLREYNTVTATVATMVNNPLTNAFTNDANTTVITSGTS